MVAPTENGSPEPKPKRRKRNPVGRPTEYDSANFPRVAREMTACGRTQEEIAKALCVNVCTVYDWKLAHPDFAEAIEQGWRVRDRAVVHALYHRAVGYSHPETHIAVSEGRVIKTPTTKFYPPSETAAKFILVNRLGSEWKERVDVSIDPGLNKLTPEEMALAWAANYRALAPIAEQHAKAIEMKNVTGTGEK